MIIGILLAIWFVCSFITSIAKYHLDAMRQLMSLNYLEADAWYWTKNITFSVFIGPLYVIWLLIKLFLWKKI